MSKQFLVPASSQRKNGNSAALCREFTRGAEESGHHVETIFLRDKKIGYCLACYHCKNSGGVCAIKDDMADILDKMNDADVIVMASPVYFYAIDARMKPLIDRTVAQWVTKTRETRQCREQNPRARHALRRSVGGFGGSRGGGYGGGSRGRRF